RSPPTATRSPRPRSDRTVRYGGLATSARRPAGRQRRLQRNEKLALRNAQQRGRLKLTRSRKPGRRTSRRTKNARNTLRSSRRRVRDNKRRAKRALDLRVRREILASLCD